MQRINISKEKSRRAATIGCGAGSCKPCNSCKEREKKNKGREKEKKTQAKENIKIFKRLK